MPVTKAENEICEECESNATANGVEGNECEGCLCKTCTPENPSKECDMACHG